MSDSVETGPWVQTTSRTWPAVRRPAHHPAVAGPWRSASAYVVRGRVADRWSPAAVRRAHHRRPAGILASQDGEPIGWCACGPRSRYAAATAPRTTLLRTRSPSEDDAVWLLPCVFVAVGHRGRGVSHALVRAAVDLAAGAGARAIEGWPLAASVGRSADAFVGREQVFTDAGFTRLDQPTTMRVVVRRELTAADPPAPSPCGARARFGRALHPPPSGALTRFGRRSHPVGTRRRGDTRQGGVSPMIAGVAGEGVPAARAGAAGKGRCRWGRSTEIGRSAGQPRRAQAGRDPAHPPRT